MMRAILHADMDAFYASVEQRDEPRLKGKPVIIGGAEGRGVVAAASYEARKYGVRSAMPGFQARKLCPQGVFLSPNMKKYAQVSGQIHAIFADFTNEIEGLALDEAFLDISGSLKLFGGAEAIGQLIKERVRDDLNLVVSVGIAHNKLLAKLACSHGKPDGLFFLQPNQVENFLRPLPIRALFGIGPKAEAKLVANGLTTIGAVARAPEQRLSDLFGDAALELRQRARGIDERPVVSHGRRKSIGEEATFAGNISETSEMREAIAGHAQAVAARARKAGVLGFTITLKCKLSTRRPGPAVGVHELYPIKTRQLSLDSPTADTRMLREAGYQLLHEMQLKESVRLIGLTLSKLINENEPRQLQLFERASASGNVVGAYKNRNTESKDKLVVNRSEELGHTLDQITEKYGKESIFIGKKPVKKTVESDKHKWGEDD